MYMLIRIQSKHKKHVWHRAYYKLHPLGFRAIYNTDHLTVAMKDARALGSSAIDSQQQPQLPPSTAVNVQPPSDASDACSRGLKLMAVIIRKAYHMVGTANCRHDRGNHLNLDKKNTPNTRKKRSEFGSTDMRDRCDR